MPSSPSDPASVVERVIRAYNAKDIDALMAEHAPEVEFYEHPSKLLAKGADALRARYVERFKESNLHAQILHRSVFGSTVIDHERVTRTFPEGPGTLELAVIYEIRDGRVAREWLVPGARTLLPS